MIRNSHNTFYIEIPSLNNSKYFTRQPITPEPCNPREIIRMEATVITAGWLKPRNISEGSTIKLDESLPKTKSKINKVHNEIIATISYLNFPHIKRMKVKVITQIII